MEYLLSARHLCKFLPCLHLREWKVSILSQGGPAALQLCQGQLKGGLCFNCLPIKVELLS